MMNSKALLTASLAVLLGIFAALTFPVTPGNAAEAQTVLGGRYASIVLAAMLERAEAINSHGGYLRTLVRKAKDGEFSLGPMLMALINTRTSPKPQQKAVFS